MSYSSDYSQQEEYEEEYDDIRPSFGKRISHALYVFFDRLMYIAIGVIISIVIFIIFLAMGFIEII